jgi:hypothetical protein
MGETAETLARYRQARVKPRRVVSEAEFRRACRGQGWSDEQIQRLLDKAGPSAWFEVGAQLLRVKAHGPA